MSPRQIRAQQLRAKVSAVAHESFDGALVVKTMGREADESRRFSVFVTELRDALISVGRLRGLFDPLMDALPSIGTLAVLLLGAWRLQTGAISVAELVSVAFLFTVLAFPVRAIGWVVAELPRSVAGWERVQAVLGAEGDLAYGSATAPGSGAAELTFDKVTFSYASGPPVLRDVSFTVPAGQTVALVGATGSGKSTMASLAVRLVDPASGAVRVNGVDLPDLSEPALARALAGRPRLLVLDDATSAVDPRVEAAILASLRRHDAGASILVVAYRRATIALADLVVFLHNGRVAAIGTHAELMATVPGYLDLVTAYEQAEAERDLEESGVTA
jgi:ABC-type multidrug transport system fused ATPase/permease subunit